MSKIEQIISEIEEYIASCRTQPFSNEKIIVNREEMEELLTELRMRTPEEVKQYQKIISNQDAILNESKAEADKARTAAKNEADTLIARAQAQAGQMIEENEITQQARERAAQIISQAQAQAQEIVDNAVLQANTLKQQSLKYTDDMLGGLQSIISHSLADAEGRFESLRGSLKSSYEIVSNNRNELAGSLTGGDENR